jgi:shikimate kinase
MKSKKNLILIGMMGSGKSTIGRLLAQKLNLKFLDIDFIISH